MTTHAKNAIADKTMPEPAGTEKTAPPRTEHLRVQTDLARMEARDRWREVEDELGRRRQAARSAARRLAGGGLAASRAVADGVRRGAGELRDAVRTVLRLLR